jgi:DNA-binding transcriptional ArsR family regulator
MSPIDVGEDPERNKLRILIDPISEMFNSLHVLADPSHHLANQQWAATTLAAMAPALREEVAYFGQHFDEWLGIADVVHLVDPTGLTVPEFLGRMAQLPPTTIVTLTLGIADEQAYAGYAAPTEAATLTALKEAQADSQSFADRLLAVLRRYWEEMFAAEWERRRPLLDQRRALELTRLDTMEPVTWLASLHDRISYDRESGSLVFHKRQELRFALQQLERIVCLPSTFTAPHLMVGYARRQLFIYINVPLSITTLERVPSALLDVAKALADETRLRIYKAVLKQPHYTQELALAMGLAEPTISRHLKILKAAKLVRSSKEGAVVLYTGIVDPVDRLPAAMREYLRG